MGARVGATGVGVFVLAVFSARRHMALLSTRQLMFSSRVPFSRRRAAWIREVYSSTDSNASSRCGVNSPGDTL